MNHQRTHHHGRARCRRRAFTMVEMSIVIALASVIVGFLGVCLQGMYRAEQRTRQQLAQRAALTQLSLRFRTDAHEAARAAPTATDRGVDNHAVLLTLQDGSTITYQATAGQINRTVQRDGKVVHHDAFRLPGVRVDWDLPSGDDPSVIAAVISHLPEPGVTADKSTYEERIEARVGLHQHRQAVSEGT